MGRHQGRNLQGRAAHTELVLELDPLVPGHLPPGTHNPTPLTFSWYWRRDESSDWMRAVAWPMNMA